MVLSLGLPSQSPAYADEYPTWEEVQEARKDVARAEAKVKEIMELLARLEVEAAEAEEEAARLGEVYYEALYELDEATFQQAQLQSQADSAATIAEESRLQAGQFVAELARVGELTSPPRCSSAARTPTNCSAALAMPPRLPSRPMEFMPGRCPTRTPPNH